MSGLSRKRLRSFQSRRKNLDELLRKRNGDGSFGFELDFDDEIRGLGFDHPLEESVSGDLDVDRRVLEEFEEL